MRSSTACLFSIDVINSDDKHGAHHLDEAMSSIPSKNIVSLPNGTSQETMLVNEGAKSPREAQIAQNSTTSPISPKSGSSGRRSGANLTVTFDFDYEN